LTDASGFNPSRGPGSGLHRRNEIIAGGRENQSDKDGQGLSRATQQSVALWHRAAVDRPSAAGSRAGVPTETLSGLRHNDDSSQMSAAPILDDSGGSHIAFTWVEQPDGANDLIKARVLSDTLN
jgi:hypothetical protein